jgi:hypothetical protein
LRSGKNGSESSERVVLSRRELARELRRKAYRDAKARRDADPRFLAMKEAAKVRRREIYRVAKERKKAAEVSAKPRQRETLESLREKNLEKKRLRTSRVAEEGSGSDSGRFGAGIVKKAGIVKAGIVKAASIKAARVRTAGGHVAAKDRAGSAKAALVRALDIALRGAPPDDPSSSEKRQRLVDLIETVKIAGEREGVANDSA